MKKCGKCSAALLAALALVLSSTSAVWAKGVEIAIAENASDIESVEANDVDDGLTIHADWNLYGNDSEVARRNAQVRFEDYLFADYGGSEGMNAAYESAMTKASVIDCSEYSTEAECSEVYFDVIFKEIFSKIGKQLVYNGPINYYLVDSGGIEYKYDGDGITIVTPLRDLEHNIDMFNRYLGEFEVRVLHEKYDGEKYEYEYVPSELINYGGNDDYYVKFTTTSLSPFAFIISGSEDEEQAPKTLDRSVVYIGVAGASAAGLFTLGVWLGRREKR